ncbi:MAG: T9SS type A sorting domain-containing protein [Bacteroidetes bacterium]|nr:T9SS type A sorting domain-containing protein [Bacteroidota bacterium]
MKKIFTFIIAGLLITLLLVAFSPKHTKAPSTDYYNVISWNDLGMHCANKDFSNMCILPPYNNISAHVILQGSSTAAPVIMDPATSGISVTYEIPGNTYSIGKTNFWTYAFQIFGVNLPDNIGLTGYGLSGTMADSNNFYHVQGIPLTPYPDNDLVNEHPYQLTLITAMNSGAEVLATTLNTIPVSNEINCVSSGCHTSEMDILQAHESVSGFNINNRPIFCAGCHADPALGTTGSGGAPIFSQAIHSAHGGIITTDCYKCHPGPNTQCLRDTMHSAGTWCTDCHGNVAHVGSTIAGGRTPWLQEPSCGATSCHGANFAEQPGLLFRQSKGGMGNLMCSTCHNSPHAILPSSRSEDNLQNFALQGFAGTLKKCDVCHGYTPSGPGPHGIYAGIKPISGIIPSQDELLPNYPNPFAFSTTIPFRIKTPAWVKLDIIDLNGKKIQSVLNERLQAGEYKTETYATHLSPGTYLCCMNVSGHQDYMKIIVVK